MRDLPSIPELRRITQPASVMDRANAEHWAGRLYMRRLSPYVTRIGLRLGLSANAATGVMAIVGLLGAWAFALRSPLALLGVVGIQLYLLLDCVDGEIARYRKTQSAAGVYLDRWAHYVVEASVFAALGIRAVGDGGSVWYAVLGMGGATLALVAKAETDLVDSARLGAGLGPMPQTATAMRNTSMATGRRLAAYFPIHRLVHAAEASLVAAVAIIIDMVRDDLAATRVVLVALVIVVALVVPLHLISVLNSTRLTASSD